MTPYYLVKISRKAVSTPSDAQDHHFLLPRARRHPTQKVLVDIVFAPAIHVITPMGVTDSKLWLSKYQMSSARPAVQLCHKNKCRLRHFIIIISIIHNLV